MLTKIAMMLFVGSQILECKKNPRQLQTANIGSD